MPEYQYLFDQGIGRIAKTSDDWMYHFDELLDPQLRSDEAALNKEMLKNFSMESRGDDWEATMRFILEQEM